jgi:hypothetical protein
MRRSLLVALVAIALHAILANVLDRGAMVERMLSPGGDGALIAAAVTIAFLLLRLAMLFVLPGWILARIVLALVRFVRLRRMPTSRRPCIPAGRRVGTAAHDRGPRGSTT